METTKNKIPPNAKLFFDNLSEYLDTKLLYFGSVQRDDYFPGKSDIDVDIFTENVDSTIVKMQQLLKIPKEKFKKIVWRLRYNGRMTNGYKTKYEDPNGEFIAEFSIYNVKFKEDILVEHLGKTVIPFYVTWLLVCLKMLHYNLDIIEMTTFNFFKKKILSICLGVPDDEFIVLDPRVNKRNDYR
jgi:hypothetical protein